MNSALSSQISAATSAPIPKHRWRIAFLLAFGVLVNYIDRINLSVAKEALTVEFGISTVTFGYLLSAYSWTYAIFQIPSGVLLDRFGVKKIGRISAFIWSIASFGASIATGVRGFLAARLLLGVGEAPTFPGNAKAVGYWFPSNERSLATAIFDAAAKFSSAIGIPIMGLLLIRFGWRWSFAATGVLSLAYFVLFSRLYRNPSEDSSLSPREREFISAGGALPELAAAGAAKGASLPYLISRKKVIGLCLGFAAYNYSFYFLLTWLPSYFSTALGLDLKHSVVYASVPWLVATVTDLLIGGWLVDALIRRGLNAAKVRKTVLVIGMAFGVGILGAASAATPAKAIFWITFSLAGLAATAPVAWSIPSVIAPKESVGSVGGILNFCSQIAAILAPIITGYIVSITHSFRSAFVVPAIFLSIGVLGYALLLGDMSRIPDEN